MTVAAQKQPARTDGSAIADIKADSLEISRCWTGAVDTHTGIMPSRIHRHLRHLSL